MTRVSGIIRAMYGRTGVEVNTGVGVRLSMQLSSMAPSQSAMIHLPMPLSQYHQESVCIRMASVNGQVRKHLYTTKPYM